MEKNFKKHSSTNNYFPPIYFEILLFIKIDLHIVISYLFFQEAMLNQLQASVESEESTWKSKIAKKEAELEQVQRQLESVESKNATLEASMNSLNSVEEVN